MATIFTDQAGAYDGSSSPTVGTADVDVTYTCSPEDGGTLELWARPNGSSIDYIKLWDDNHPRMVKFRANGLQYYYVWTPKTANAIADLEG